MAKLVIEGDKKYLDKLVRENRSRKNRWGLKITLTEAATKAVKDKGSKLKAVEAIALIQKVENVEDLEQFESDDRATVVEALNLRKEELDLA